MTFKIVGHRSSALFGIARFRRLVACGRTASHSCPSCWNRGGTLQELLLQPPCGRNMQVNAPIDLIPRLADVDLCICLGLTSLQDYSSEVGQGPAIQFRIFGGLRRRFPGLIRAAAGNLDLCLGSHRDSLWIEGSLPTRMASTGSSVSKNRAKVSPRCRGWRQT